MGRRVAPGLTPNVEPGGVTGRKQVVTFEPKVVGEYEERGWYWVRRTTEGDDCWLYPLNHAYPTAALTVHREDPGSAEDDAFD